MSARSNFLCSLLSATVALPSVSARAQVKTIRAPVSPSATITKAELLVSGRVTTVTGEPVIHAQVQVDIGAGPNPVRTLETNLKGEFETDYSLDRASSRGRTLNAVAMKTGYAEAFEAADLASVGDAWKVDLVMRDAEEKPEQLPLAQLISLLSARFQVPLPGNVSLAAESAGSLRAALQLLVKGDPAGAAPILAQVVHHEPDCVECRTLLGLAMLGRGSWSSAVREFNQAVAGSASETSSPPRAEPFLILGVIEDWRKDLQKAADFLLQALKANPQDPLALQELGRCLVFQRSWAEADKYLAQAIKAGAPAEAHLLRARALLSQGIAQEAQAEMTTYLGGRNARDLPVGIRGIWSEMVERLEWESSERPKSLVEQPLPELVKALPELKGLEPGADAQELPNILRKVGEGVDLFFHGFPNTSSLEQIREERLQRKGKVTQSLDQQFQYLCLAPPERSGLGFVEYRTERSGLLAGPRGLEEGFMLTAGFASASLPFHPVYQSDAAFRYLGRQQVDGHEAFVIAYAQRPEAARLTGAFRVNDASVSTLSQGLAWIDQDSYQIIRMRTDLLSPFPKVGLERETTEIHFGRVRFKEISAELWLPRAVTVTVQWRGRTLRNTHNYSEFKLFHVQTKQREAKVIEFEPPDSN